MLVFLIALTVVGSIALSGYTVRLGLKRGESIALRLEMFLYATVSAVAASALISAVVLVKLFPLA